MMTSTRKLLCRLSDRLNALVIAFCATLLAAMLVVSASGVAADLAASASRSFLGREIFSGGFGGWLYANTRPSVVRVFLPWLGMLSITVAFKFCEHVAIDLFSNGLPDRALVFLKAVNLLAIAAFGGLLAWYGLEFFLASNRNFIVSSTLTLSQRWTVASVPVAGLVLCVHLADGFRLLDEVSAARQAEAGEVAGKRALGVRP